MNDQNKPLVAIHCLVYNHEPYLRDCFEGFVMQQTNFQFIAIVHDDASTDKSAEIIREYSSKYPEIFKPIYETENQYSKRDGTIHRIMYNAIEKSKAKYVAMCEGDDYWIDPFKLQKQVDFLDNHNEYGFIGTKCLIRKEDKISKEKITYLKDPNEIKGNYELYGDVFLKYAIYGPPTRTVSLLYRKDLLDNENPIGDYSQQAILAYKSKFAMLNEECCVYRRHRTGVSNAHDDKSKIAYTKWYIAQKNFLMERFPNDYFFNQDELNDILLYQELKIAIKNIKYSEARKIQKSIKSPKYRNKKLCKYLKNYISFLILALYTKTNNITKNIW